MKLPAEEKARLEGLCAQFRRDLIETLHARQTGHPGGSLSVCEILTTLYFEEMNVDPKDPQMADRDRLVLCKGHAAPMLYRVLAEKGFFPVEEMATLRCFETRLQGHPCPLETPGVDAATGPLGIGLSTALGMSMALKLNNSPARVYAILGDGEINEGTVWEALMAAVKYKADNLCAVLDWNGVQLDGTADQIMPMGDIRAKFEAFGWHCIECDGHDVDALYDAFEQAKTIKGLPTIVLAHTIKGKGVSFMEGKNTWHGAPINDENYEKAMIELGGAK
ncbi:transketolase [Pseudoflavonifractor phocaeensis]|jgi:transketolase|uniref:transketolase n=1 Tax=Pseudoflavonifractor phocaeensis TaxID=1870988 RepID=UPI0025A3A8D0|nr:transketolase [Pseudoflavonifractor phocaeensis]MDM8239831.1 transketolase [Pseudoflavonifractor phocaeensis]